MARKKKRISETVLSLIKSGVTVDRYAGIVSALKITVMLKARYANINVK